MNCWQKNTSPQIYMFAFHLFFALKHVSIFIGQLNSVYLQWTLLFSSTININTVICVTHVMWLTEDIFYMSGIFVPFLNNCHRIKVHLPKALILTNSQSLKIYSKRSMLNSQ